jgi:hypothetical protein
MGVLASREGFIPVDVPPHPKVKKFPPLHSDQPHFRGLTEKAVQPDYPPPGESVMPPSNVIAVSGNSSMTDRVRV